MCARILVVDDDANLLAGLRRQLRQRYDLATAQSGDEALATIANGDPFAVVMSDMRMPGMDGIELLRRVQVVSADSVRIMLTGNSDQQTAVNAVNEGRIFRFLNKPCSNELLESAINAGIDQYRLITAERQLLTETVAGSVKLLTEILSLVCPTAFSRCSRLRDLVLQLAHELNVDNAWECEVAAMLSQVGCVTIPDSVLERRSRGETLDADDRRRFRLHPQVGRELISLVPRLEGVAEIIGYQGKHFDGSGLPQDGIRGDMLPLGARILKVADDFDALLLNGCQQAVALKRLGRRQGMYDPIILEALAKVVDRSGSRTICCNSLDDLPDDAIIEDDVMSRNGLLLIGRGQRVTPSLRIKLRNYDASVGVRLPFNIQSAL